MKFTYVNITGKNCDGWLNLFFGEYHVVMVDDIELANSIRQEIEEQQEEPSLLSRIANNQVLAGEQVVMANLKKMGFDI